MDTGAVSGGSGNANKNTGTLQQMLLTKPNLDKQIEIAENFPNIDTKNTNYLLRKEQLENLFLILLHQLMTAQIPGYDLNLSAFNIDPQGGDE